jgi:two-component system NtrC family sensor kinase
MEASSMRRSRRYFDSDGQEVMGIARGIYNQENCTTVACHIHSPDMRMLGVLDVSVSLEEMHQQIDVFRRNLVFWTIGLLTLLILTLALLTRRLVHRPVDKLLAHTRLLAQGELTMQIEDVERDEMGELEEAFNDMTNNLRVAQEELQYLANSLEVKVEERTRQIQHIQGQLVRSEKLASLGELVAGIAHEINNPLTGIMVFSSLALENPRLHPGLRPDIETIFRETQRCAGIVQGLLEFSREATPEKGQESVNNILEKALRLLENQAGFHDIVIHRQLDPNLPKILVDANQLNQVFINIILNAAQAMPGGGELTLTTGLDEARHQLFVRVRDTGCGIPQENIKRIFDPFFTTKEQGGTGLGLSVSYGIIENHGGTIEVESEEGKGTTFVVLLPLEPAQNQPGSAAEKWVTRESQPAKTPPAGDHS